MAWSSTSITASSSSSSSSHQWKYDVFLSFRGEDTRKTFTDFLYRELDRKWIRTFKDDPKLEKGEQISSSLLKAIEESRFSIIIFSEDYASSSWCLDELTKILDCVTEMGHTAIPVFYNVDPSDVRKQANSFAKAFEEHEKNYRDKLEKVGRWREACTAASNLAGYDSRNRCQTEFVDEIVSNILNKLFCGSSSNMEGLVGMASRIEDVDKLLDIGSVTVRMVGIWGMAGIGKTTIAEQVYQKISAQFGDGCCFLQDVREASKRHGLAYLKAELCSQILKGENLNKGYFNSPSNFIKERLHCRKVLIVLDDVDAREQLDALVERKEWFGPGSRIVITTRDKALLKHVDEIYAAGELQRNEALNLFCRHAFNRNSPLTEDYMQLCEDFVDCIHGLPLAIKVMGSFVENKTIDEWKSALDKLKRIPHNDIQEKLRISYDGLQSCQKDVFLDIAVFFKGLDRDYVKEILKSPVCFPATEMRVLEDRSLITVVDNKLCMHDLLQEMALEIVRQEDVKNPRNRSRLCFYDEVYHVLKTIKGKEAVEGITYDLSASEKLEFSADAFKEMDMLRLIRFYNVKMGGSFEYLSKNELMKPGQDAWRWRDYEMQTDCELILPGDLKLPSLNLRSLYWHGYPFKSFPLISHRDNLIELNMCSSRLEKLWNGKESYPKLKYIKLCHSQYLKGTPDFSGVPNLRRLILKDCASLVTVDPSIGALKSLIFLNLEGCRNLECFASSIHMNSLEILVLSGCSKLKKFPEILKNMKCLKELFLDETALRELPSSIEHLSGLVLLNLAYCKELVRLPQSTCKLTSLQILTLTGCSELKKLPDELGSLKCLVQLNANGSAIQVLPPSIVLLTNLEVLSLGGCKKKNVVSSFWSSPTKWLQLHSKLNIWFLQSLNLHECNLSEGALPSDLSSLSSLTYLDLSGNNFISIPNLSSLSRLKSLDLSDCMNLQSVPALPSKIKSVVANHCSSLDSFSFSSVTYPSWLYNKFLVKFCNCLGLLKNERAAGAIIQGVERVAASMHKFMDNPDTVCTWAAIVSGSSIPDWFIHQNDGSYVIVELPLHSNLLGLAVCASFVGDPTNVDGFDICLGCVKCLPYYNSQGRDDASQGRTMPRNARGWEWLEDESPWLYLDPQYINVEPKYFYNDLDGIQEKYCIGQRIRKQIYPETKADHLWFGYYTLCELKRRCKWWPKGINVQRRTVNFYIHVSNRFILEVKKFGVRLVYEQGQESENPLCKTEHPPSIT